MDARPRDGSVAGRKNRRAVEDYVRFLRSSGRAESTLAGNRDALGRLGQFLAARGKTFAIATRRDLEDFQASLTVGSNTVAVIMSKVKAYHRARHPDTFGEVAAWIKAAIRPRDWQPSDMLTEDELLGMVRKAASARNKALLVTLYESAMRAQEFLSLRVGDVRFNDDGTADLVLPQGAKGLKTGRREVPVVECVPYLQHWLELHSGREDPSAPLWPARGGAPMSYMSLYQLVAASGKAAGIPKHLTPHLLRHSRSTAQARRGWNEAALRRYGGWGRTSRMPSHYVHLGAEDVKAQVLKDAGMMVREVPHGPALVETCRTCGAQTPKGNTYCTKCLRPLSLENVMEERRRERIQGTDIRRLAQKVEVLEGLVKKLADVSRLDEVSPYRVEELDRLAIFPPEDVQRLRERNLREALAEAKVGGGA